MLTQNHIDTLKKLMGHIIDEINNLALPPEKHQLVMKVMSECFFLGNSREMAAVKATRDLVKQTVPEIMKILPAVHHLKKGLMALAPTTSDGQIVLDKPITQGGPYSLLDPAQASPTTLREIFNELTKIGQALYLCDEKVQTVINSTLQIPTAIIYIKPIDSRQPWNILIGKDGDAAIYAEHLKLKVAEEQPKGELSYIDSAHIQGFDTSDENTDENLLAEATAMILYDVGEDLNTSISGAKEIWPDREIQVFHLNIGADLTVKMLSIDDPSFTLPTQIATSNVRTARRVGFNALNSLEQTIEYQAQNKMSGPR